MGKLYTALLLVFCIYVSVTYSKKFTVNFSGLVGEFCGASSTPGCSDAPPCPVPSPSACPSVCQCPDVPVSSPCPGVSSTTPGVSSSAAAVSSSSPGSSPARASSSFGVSSSSSPAAAVTPSGCPVCPPCISLSVTPSNTFSRSLSASASTAASVSPSTSIRPTGTGTRTPSVTVSISFSSSFTPSPSPNPCGPLYEASATNNQFRVGMLFARSNFATSAAAPGYYGALYAISQINAAGGIRIGNQNVTLDPRIVDTQSLPNVTVDAANNLIGAQCAAVLVGTETSAERKAILPRLESTDASNAAPPLLLAPMRWEGAENSSAVIHFGGNIAQNVIPALQWAIANGRTHIHLIGSDDIDSRVINAVARAYLAQFSNVTVIGEDYIYMGTGDAGAATTFDRPQLVGANLINAAGANPCPSTNYHCYLLFSSVFGQAANRVLYQALGARYLRPAVDPSTLSYQVMNLRISVYELLSFIGTNTNYQLVASNYFNNITGGYIQGGTGALAQWQQGIENFINTTGSDNSTRQRGSQTTTDAEINAYYAVMTWASVVAAAGTANPSVIRGRMIGASFNGPLGTWTIGSDRNVQSKNFYIGQLYAPIGRANTNSIIYTQNNIQSNLYPVVGSLTASSYAALESTIQAAYGGNYEQLAASYYQD